MTKTILQGSLFFLVGVSITALVLLNPFGWSWLGPFRTTTLESVGVSSGEAGETIEHRLWTCGMHPQVMEEEPGPCPICGMAMVPARGPGVQATNQSRSRGEGRIKYWQSPMDPTYISDKPGKSPMGMDLIPVYEDETEERPGTVRIDPTFIQNLGIQSTAVMRTDIPFTIRTVGTFTYNDSQLVWVNTKYDGWIEQVYVNYVGEPVQRGQKLFEIYSPQLVTTQKEYLNALAYAERLSNSSYPDIAARTLSLVESSRQRLAYWDLTQEQVRELEKSQEPLRTLTVFSPADGVVVEKIDQALEGMHVKAGANLYKIADLSSIWLEAEIFESQVPWLKVGQTARVDVPYEPDKHYRGTVRYLYPYFNEKTRTMKVSIELPNPGQKMRADMYANVTFAVPSARAVLAIPEEAVIHSGRRNIVVLDLGNGTFQVNEVTLGVNGQGLWEVKEGLAEGARVVVSSQFLIDSESNLREAIRKMISAADGDEITPAAVPTDQQ